MESLRETIGNHKRKLTTLLFIVALAVGIGGVHAYLGYR